MAQAPARYEKNEKGNWVVSQEWKEWDNNRKEKKSIVKTRAPEKIVKTAAPKKVTSENHREVWREIAYSPDTGKRIYFCACMSASGQFYLGCGAVAIRRTRTGQIIKVIESRFE